MRLLVLLLAVASDFSIRNNGEDTVSFCYDNNCTVAAFTPRVLNGRTSLALAVYECHSVLRVYYDCASLSGAFDECDFVEHVLVKKEC